MTDVENNKVTRLVENSGNSEISADMVLMKNVQKFQTNAFVYFIGDTLNGWKVNRYNIDNVLASAEGEENRPINLIECEALIYV